MFVVNAPQELLLLDNKVGTLSRGEFGWRVERFDGEGTGMFKGGGIRKFCPCVMLVARF